MIRNLKAAAILMTAPALALAAPVSAAPQSHASTGVHAASHSSVAYEYGRDRDRRWRQGRGYDRYDRYDNRRDGRYRNSRYEQPVNRNTRVWRGNDGQYYCRKDDGTTGLLIGAGVGALIGHEVAGRNGDRTLGAILGAAGGALLGRTIDRSSTRCR